MCNFCSNFAAFLEIYGITFAIFTRVDDDQFPVLRAGVGTDEYLAELYQST